MLRGVPFAPAAAQPKTARGVRCERPRRRGLLPSRCIGLRYAEAARAGQLRGRTRVLSVGVVVVRPRKASSQSQSPSQSPVLCAVEERREQSALEYSRAVQPIKSPGCELGRPRKNKTSRQAAHPKVVRRRSSVACCSPAFKFSVRRGAHQMKTVHTVRIQPVNTCLCSIQCDNACSCSIRPRCFRKIPNACSYSIRPRCFRKISKVDKKACTRPHLPCTLKKKLCGAGTYR